MLTKIEDFTSHFRYIEIKKASGDSLVPLIDLSLNKAYRESLKGLRGIQLFQSHIRLSALTLEFWHDGMSLPRVTLPEIDELEPAFKQEIAMRDWLMNVPKRIAEIWLQDKPFREPSEFIYTEKGLISEVDFLGLLGRESLVVDKSLSIKIPGGLNGNEKLRCYVAWDEYFSVTVKQ